MSIKKYVLVFLFFMLTNLIITICALYTSGAKSDVASFASMPLENEQKICSSTGIAAEEIPTLEASATVRLYLIDTGETVLIDIEEYIVGVLTGEMYIDTPMEALKAMAVAARTYTLYMCEENENRPYDVASDHNLSQAYIDKDTAIEAWNDAGEEKYMKMQQAVLSTAGEILCYDNRPICALYHASSYPYTESSENIFIESLPYLVGEKSVETLESAYSSSVSFTIDDFNHCLTSNGYPSVQADELQILNKKNENERCKYLFIKDKMNLFTVDGRKVRSVFSLKSTSFEVVADSNTVTFEVYGFGHGVGLSQNGAIEMARTGETYHEILYHYYPKTEIYKTIYNQ